MKALWAVSGAMLRPAMQVYLVTSERRKIGIYFLVSFLLSLEPAELPSDLKVVLSLDWCWDSCLNMLCPVWSFTNLHYQGTLFVHFFSLPVENCCLRDDSEN